MTTALRLETLAQGLERLRVALGKSLRARLQELEQYVVVSNMSEQVADPAQLVPETVGPRAVEHRSKRPQVRAEPPGSDPGAVDRLRVLPDADQRVVIEELFDRRGKYVPDEFLGRGLGAGLRRDDEIRRCLRGFAERPPRSWEGRRRGDCNAAVSEAGG